MNKLYKYYSAISNLAYIYIIILDPFLKINYYREEEQKDNIVEVTINSFNFIYKKNYINIIILEDQKSSNISENNFIFKYFK